MNEPDVELTEAIPARARAWERLAILLVFAFPACTTTPPAPYDCMAPPALRGVVKVKDPIPNRYIVVLKPTAGAAAPDVARVAARFPQARNVTAFTRALSGFSASMDARHHFTGSKEHNVAMRGRAKQLGIKRNEYGPFRGDALIPCASEQDVFSALGLAWVPPELRENTGEIEAAETGVMPSLVEGKDIRGILHIHTSASDESSSLEAIVAAAKKMGLEYVGITDHSEAAFYAGGLTPEAVRRQHKAIDAMNRKDPAFHIFKGIEADILPDGRLDYDDATLETFDFVIAAIHSHFGMSEEEMTARILKGLENRHTTILAHPTGPRGRRPGGPWIWGRTSPRPASSKRCAASSRRSSASRPC